METLRRPELRPGHVDKALLGAYALLALGFCLIVLSIYEVGGLFNLGLGLLVVHLGEIAVFAHEDRRRRWEEDVFRGLVDGP
jgi:hypothetical protein